MKVYRMTIDNILEEKEGVDAIAFVDEPAIERYFVAFHSAGKERVKVYFNDEKRIVVSPVLIPDQMIMRIDEKGEMYYLYSTKEDIEKIHANAMYKGIKFNFMHDSVAVVEQVSVLASYIYNKDISTTTPQWFSDLPDGTWFIALRINDETLWEMIKDKVIKGISIEGVFNIVEDASATQTSIAAREEDIDNLLKELL